MRPIRQRVPVVFHYDVHFTSDLFRTDHPLLADVVRGDGGNGPKKVLVAADEGMLAHHPGLLKRIAAYAAAHRAVMMLAGEPVVLPGGEAAKNDPLLVDHLHEAIHEASLDRHAYVLGVGGGAVLDVVGYAAATAHRGIRLIRVPTTVLAQNDSGIGVKNGINAFGKKNFLGTFAPPYAVLNDFTFLETLADEDWRSGISEAVKVALLKDARFFDFLETRAEALAARDLQAMQQLIYRCAELHLQHIARSGDPFEMGSSRPLDFGHWSAHKLEQLTDYRLPHGAAVAVGIALDCTYARLQGMLAEPAWERVLRVLERVGFRLYVPEMSAHLADPDHPRCLFRGLEEFREHLGGRLTIMLLEDIGRGVEVNEVDRARYVEAVSILRARDEVWMDPDWASSSASVVRRKG